MQRKWNLEKIIEIYLLTEEKYLQSKITSLVKSSLSNQHTTIWTTTQSISTKLTTDQVTFLCNVCNWRSFITLCELNQHLRSCLKKSRDTDVNILASHVLQEPVEKKIQLIYWDDFFGVGGMVEAWQEW